MYDAWIDAVATKDPQRIASLISEHTQVLYDDAWTGVHSAECQPWLGGLRTITTPAERTQLATCIATTVTHSRATDPTHRTGEVSLEDLAPLVDAPMLATLGQLPRDHRFIHGHSVGAGEFDFTLALARDAHQVDVIGLTVLRGE
jgi:hypothetical protein